MTSAHLTRMYLSLAFALAFVSGSALAQLPSYTVVEFDLLNGSSFSGQRLNHNGTVLGYTSVVQGQVNHFVPAIWKDGNFIELPEDKKSLPISIISLNDSGTVTGYEEVSLPFGQALIAGGGQLRSLGTLGGHYSYGLAINNKNVVVGYSTVNIPAPPNIAFIWESGRMSILPPLADGYSSALELNENNDVVGWSWDESWRQRPVLWPADGSGPINLSPSESPTFPEQAADINEAGQIVGLYSEPDDTSFHRAFVWQDGVLSDLGVLPEAGGDGPYGPENINTRAIAVNDLGLIVGDSSPHFPDSPNRPAPFLWIDGEMHNLNDLLATNADADADADADETDVTYVSSVLDINNEGKILARIQVGQTFETRTVLLVPSE